MKIVFATHNLNKLREVKALLPSFKILSLQDIDCYNDIPETAENLEGNAQIKADYVTSKYGYNCIADDTGLEVASLQGAPGVYSARYAGDDASSEKNIQKLLLELELKDNRNAQFRTVIVLNLNNESFLFQGICKGEILTDKQGENGFGYDSIFKPYGYQTSFAQMSMAEKGAISHRGKAIQKLINYLNSIA